jgi:hypothetical protein
LFFFRKKYFDNFWFDTGSPSVLAKILKKNHVTIEEFRGKVVSNKFVKNPGKLGGSNIVSLLYQSGYLTLRPGDSADTYSLDYPNREVLMAMSELFVTNCLGEDKTTEVNINLKKALDAKDVEGVIAQFDKFLSSVIYDDYNDANRADTKNVTVHLDGNKEIYYFNAFFFGALLRSLLNMIGARLSAEVHGSLGRADIVFEWKQKFWVIELKVAKEGENVETLLVNAVARIISQHYAEPYDDPVCLAIVINEKLRKVAVCKDFYPTQS